ncbi:MAG: hypothetical protein DRP56_02600 [Planctomycetota bacterium]|nr:MAG: hypothetical protein B6I22_11435 [Desulfobacteraceae bacterium 4572_123]RKY09453.1 MAG: hypothetical protein DRP56_02600 [Planctomycetota bacterium]
MQKKTIVLILGLLIATTAWSVEYTDEQINEMINNPLGELWMLFFQNDYTSYTGDALDFLDEDDKVFNTTIFQPVMPFQLTEDWKYIFRPVIQLHNWETPSASLESPTGVDFERHTKLGDTIFWNAFATNEMAKPPNVYGVGFTAMIPTASDDAFGTGKWSAGPMALAVHVGPPGGFIFGGIVQHWWDFAGESGRDHVNLTNIQYLGYYRLTDATNIGFGPNIICDWTADSGNQWTIPVGGGLNTTIKLGKLPVKIGLEYYTYVEKPDNFGPDWTLRFIFSPIIPSPAFSKVPIF